jgi:hypothetical protein
MLSFDYQLRAIGNAITSEPVGYQALVGDPFQISGGFEIGAAPTAVPEPASMLLMAAGLAGMLPASVARRRRRDGGAPVGRISREVTRGI